MYMFPQLGSGPTILELIENDQKTFFSSTKKMLITSNFVGEIWHYKIRVEDIDSAI